MAAAIATAPRGTRARVTIPSAAFLAIVSIVAVLALAAHSEAFAPTKTMSVRSKLADASSSASSVDERMLQTYNTLATRLIDRYERESANLRNGQLFVCIAGGPGSGKSTLSTALSQLINERMPPAGDAGEPAAAVVLPMDGYHYSRAELRSMGESPATEYSYDELLARRGAPWTFDAEGCIAAFTDARKTGEANLPVYSRAKSDPVANGVQLHRETKIVLLEGNYLLAWGDERWAPLRTNNVFDETWYIACHSLEEQRERLVKRHLETWSDEKTKMFGAGAEGAGAKADSNDMLNLEWIEEHSREYADLVIESV